MQMRSLKDSYLNYCEKKNYEKNLYQLKIIDLLVNFLDPKNSIFNFFNNSKQKKCFYLYGGVGVGKTMILNFVYDFLYIPKQRLHFNEFMINFHNYRHKMNNKDNSLSSFVQSLKKYKLIYLDEFQVTNIVDAMILGKLFEKIFYEEIKIILTSNVKLDDLYKDGLQRDQFLPFIKVMKDRCYEEKLTILEDYRKSHKNINKRYFHPLNDATNFKINKLFRQLTKGKVREEKILTIKGRKFIIKNYYAGIIRFNFKELCNKNIGAEDYIKITKTCNFIIIENLPYFNDNNSNQQQRFITLIDILYEKNIPLMISSELQLDLLSSSEDLKKIFKRTISRLYELTSIKYNKL